MPEVINFVFFKLDSSESSEKQQAEEKKTHVNVEPQPTVSRTGTGSFEPVLKSEPSKLSQDSIEAETSDER